MGIFFSQSAAASDTIEKSGDALVVLIPAIAYGTTFYLDDDEGRTQFYKSFFTNLAVTQGLKSTIKKERPDGSDKSSFPSGHTSIAFQGATFLYKRYGFKYGIPAYIGAAFVGYSRVQADKHYIEDVLAGAAIGTISSLYFTEPYKGVTVTPTANNGYYGITVSKNW
ncbi:MAG: phosphatase PAP2 family protein [Deltaproteobacteria bacterium]|nr:phosphatase PAP2 family protein [Deltaproteobacteria bacterium]